GQVQLRLRLARLRRRDTRRGPAPARPGRRADRDRVRGLRRPPGPRLPRRAAHAQEHAPLRELALHALHPREVAGAGALGGGQEGRVPYTPERLPSPSSKVSPSQPGENSNGSSCLASPPLSLSSMSSVWSGSWWKVTSRLTSATVANCTAWVRVLWPQPMRLAYSSSVYWASWTRMSAPRAIA